LKQKFSLHTKRCQPPPTQSKAVPNAICTGKIMCSNVTGKLMKKIREKNKSKVNMILLKNKRSTEFKIIIQEEEKQ
jgi:hypothetical protein